MLHSATFDTFFKVWKPPRGFLSLQLDVMSSLFLLPVYSSDTPGCGEIPQITRVSTQMWWAWDIFILMKSASVSQDEISYHKIEEGVYYRASGNASIPGWTCATCSEIISSGMLSHSSSQETPTLLKCKKRSTNVSLSRNTAWSLIFLVILHMSA